MLFGILAELLLLFSLTRRDLGRGCSQVDSGPWKHIDTVKKIRIYIFYMNAFSFLQYLLNGLNEIGLQITWIYTLCMYYDNIYYIFQYINWKDKKKI